jgi:transposase
MRLSRGTGASDGVCIDARDDAMSRVELISGPERRRRWSEDQKRSIVAEAFAPGGSVCAVARRADVVPGQIYRWRQELLASGVGFAEVMVTPGSSDKAAPPGGLAMEIEFGGNIRVRIPARMPKDLASAVVKALVAR